MAKKSAYEQICADFQTMGVDFRINDLDESLEVKMSGDWQVMDDTTEALINMELYNMGYGSKKKFAFSAAKNAWITLGHDNRYNPLKDYFDHCAETYVPLRRDMPGYAYSLAEHFANPDEMFPIWLHKWAVGVVAKVYEGERNPVLVLAGGQRIGKTSFARWLCPVPGFFHEGGINPDKKDDRLRLMNTLIWEVGELGATTRRADIEALKGFLTMAQVKERPPYGKRPIEKRSVCSFIGTVNPDGAGFLNDPTGSSRFLTCQIDYINFGYANHNKHCFWEEAAWYYHNKPRAWELTPKEKARQVEINASYETVSPLDDIIELCFEITHEDGDFMTTQQIKRIVAEHYRITSEDLFYKSLSRALYKQGLRKHRAPYDPDRPHGRGWLGIKHRGEVTKLE